MLSHQLKYIFYLEVIWILSINTDMSVSLIHIYSPRSKYYIIFRIALRILWCLANDQISLAII